MNNIKYLVIILTSFIVLSTSSVYAQNDEKQVDVKDILFSHVEDSYGWHITTIGEKEITIHLPIILYNKEKGWSFFSSKKLRENKGGYNDYYIAENGLNSGKIVVKNKAGEEVRPLDLSITKVTLALFINSVLLLIIILGVARWYKKNDTIKKAPKGFVGFMEAFIMMINDEIIKPCVGSNYKKFSPYLLTAFFFIFE